MERIGKILSRLTLALSLVSFAGVIVLMVLNVADVVMTKTAASPIPGAYEISEVLLLCTIMASFAYGQTNKTHINMTLFLKYLPKFLALPVYGVMGLLSGGTAGAVGYAAVLQAKSAIQKGAQTGVLAIPLYPFYYVEAVAMFIFALVLLFDAVVAFAAVRDERLRHMVTADWS
ncbi:MAG: TRAP transporter small permease [Thermoleophilia bacterium]|nr:TRAP transporter small permease [Thermoleophilia bacterium]